MANIEALGLDLKPAHAHAFGNLAVVAGQISLASVGSINDVLRFVRVPTGATLLDVSVVVSDAATALTDLDVGYENADGTAGGDVDYFIVAGDIATKGVLRASAGNAPVKLTQDAYIIGTILTANNIEAAVLDVVVTYRYDG